MQQWHDFLQELQRSVESELSIRFVWGAEIEFFVSVNSQPVRQSLTKRIEEVVEQLDLGVERFQQEEYPMQYEVSFAPTIDGAMLAERICSFRELLTSRLSRLSCITSFLAKPLDTAPGNGMHLHLHLEDDDGNRLFAASGPSQQNLNMFASTIEALCATMNQAMVFFAPCAHAFARLQKQSFSQDYQFCGAPQTVSWGNNNRTCALRIPDTLGKPATRRIEHRTPAACSNPYACIASIIAGTAIGIRQQLPLSHTRTQSDARTLFDGLPHLVRNREEAVTHYLNNPLLHQELFSRGRGKYLPLVQHLLIDRQPGTEPGEKVIFPEIN